MASASIDTLFDDVLESLASSPGAQALIDYRPPDHLQMRLDMLIEKNRIEALTADETAELNEFLRMNRLMSRLKLKARKHLPPS